MHLTASRKWLFCCVKNCDDYQTSDFCEKSDVLGQKNGVVFAALYDNPLKRVVNTV